MWEDALSHGSCTWLNIRGTTGQRSGPSYQKEIGTRGKINWMQLNQMWQLTADVRNANDSIVSTDVRRQASTGGSTCPAPLSLVTAAHRAVKREMGHTKSKLALGYRNC